MSKPKYLVSTTALVNYLASVVPANPGPKLTVNVYADSDTGLNLRHVTGTNWIEAEAVAFVASFDFYGEFAPITKAQIKRTVQHSRANN